jgi:hypothetical protein
MRERRRGRLLAACSGASRQWVAVALWLLVVVLLGGCSSPRQHGGDTVAQSSQTVQPAGSASGSGESATAGKDPTQMDQYELLYGPGVLEFGVSELLREVGVLGLLDDYIINVPLSASFISYWDIARAWTASDYLSAESGDDAEALDSFMGEVLSFAIGAIDDVRHDEEFVSLLDSRGSQMLHEAFYEALEDCGRRSRWPEIELFVMGDGHGGDVLYEHIEPVFGLSYYEYHQLKHECARHAATYPTLDEAVRDELLEPQRAHFAGAVLDGLAASPHIEVPDRYRAEVEELRANGW